MQELLYASVLAPVLPMLFPHVDLDQRESCCLVRELSLALRDIRTTTDEAGDLFSSSTSGECSMAWAPVWSVGLLLLHLPLNFCGYLQVNSSTRTLVARHC